MPSCSTGRHAFLFHMKTCLLAEQGDISSCWTRRHVFLLNKKTCLLVPQEDMSSCSARRHVFLFNKTTCLLVEQEDMSYCGTRRHVFLRRPGNSQCKFTPCKFTLCECWVWLPKGGGPGLDLSNQPGINLHRVNLGLGCLSLGRGGGGVRALSNPLKFWIKKRRPTATNSKARRPNRDPTKPRGAPKDPNK